MMRIKQATESIGAKKFVFPILVMIIAGSIGLGSVTATSNSQFSQTSAVASEIPAFPGAEGFGAQTVGGRGGQVIEVTNLNDSGPGSLRAATQTDSPRIVVFRVSGTIELESTLSITHPYITIAGQTAPGKGIALKNSPSNKKATITITTHDVIIRYLRVRPGPSTEPSHALDAVSMLGASNVIIDHSSFSWGTDENIDTWEGAHDITIQWSIISEALYLGTGGSGTGMLLGSEGSYNISVHHNLFAHNRGRTPRMNMAGVADVVNNIIYNTRHEPSTINNAFHLAPPVNYVANYVKKGFDSYKDFLVGTKGAAAEIYVKGNITAGRPTNDLNEVEGVVEEESTQYVVPVRHAAAPVTTSSAVEAYDQVLANAGATLPVRDTVDERIVNDVINGTGVIITDPAVVGGWPDLTGGTPPPDSDHDGMPDAWENHYGFNPNLPWDRNADGDGDGYTNLEEFLNNTVVLDIRVNTGNDDAEEILSTGQVRLGNSDLDLVTDGANDQLVGLRFQNVTIPNNTFISKAYIEFETDETDTIPTSLTFHAQASDSAPAFLWCSSSSPCFDISSRLKTTASVAWNTVPAWNTVGEKHQSPNLTPVVQEIVNRAGWVSSNSLVFLISGSGTRIAEAYDSAAAVAPLLHIEFSPSPGEPPEYHYHFLPILFRAN